METDEKLKDMVLFLDSALTGKNWHTVNHTWNVYNRSPDWFINRGEYYLSDGGYSRIIFGRTGLFLTSNSRDEVKAAWMRCSELINDINTLLFDYAEKNGIDL